VLADSALFKSMGATAPTEGSPDARLEALAKSRAKEKGISFEQAYTQVAAENRDLAREAIGSTAK
jgi:hypothetical protein